MTGIDITALEPEYEDVVKVLKTQITEHSLPLWCSEGWDPATGGFVEKLDIEGRADRAAPWRVRVQARQIYCFAKAADLGWYPQGREIAMKGLEYLLAKAKSPDGRPDFVHLLEPDGSTMNATRDMYDHAFVLLALSTVYRLSHDAQVLGEIKSLFNFLDVDLRSPPGGFVEGFPATLRQIIGRFHSGLFVLSHSLRYRGSGAGSRLAGLSSMTCYRN
jgi:mannose/cellobiose epimerase-like protein (N-acyl-D-glucosamine 2-epimerase family)